MTHKIAIAISGAVSLGSYESGTVYEIINAVKLHNEANPNDRIEIDVLSGASAGGMTAAMIAQKLLYDGAALEDPEDNCLHEIWVNRVDINDLLNPELGDDPNKSLLSSNHIANNAKYVFLDRYKQNTLEIKPHAAVGDNVYLGLALSNLNGVDYELPTFTSDSSSLSQGEFIQTRNQDRYTTSVNADCDNASFWTKVMTVGMGCGAFPLAFRPVSVKREWNTDDYKGLGAKNWLPDFDGEFNYADGGIFNNTPLGFARELSLRTDKCAADADKRFYFYISPNAKASTVDYEFNQQDSTMVKSLGQVTKCILNNSGFQDWIKTDSINGAIDKLHLRAKGLLNVVLASSEEDLNAMRITTQQFCTMLYQEREGQVDTSYEDDLIRAEETFMRYVPEGVMLTDDQKSLWLKSILIMEINAELIGKDKMRIYTITAKDTELASSPVAAFFGFLDVRFRKHDYLMGRLKARQTINSIIASVKQGDTQQLPLNIDTLDTTVLEKELHATRALRHATMADVALATRRQLYVRLKDRSTRILRSLGMSWLVSWGVFRFVLRRQIKQFLQL